ncbi:hypothetical protein BCR39DRAFT_472108 [Naematelia encephala]|uniref:Sodium/calcium exchanger protein-domain-containing protein n=1 Tax=Naematelia encephala TaxID=71784 RepID=A0A1Y2AQC3_9TREE|nr:hypothetical protein BCR39DRAFT_472108 [Naematelia encephala]
MSNSGEATPRGTQRGIPHTAYGSAFGSPNNQHGQMSSDDSALRPARAPRYNTSQGFPPGHNNHAWQGTGSMSRSGSRARPPLHTRNSGGQIGLVSSALAKNGGGDEDDEAEIEDRGQALIRKRQRERKQRRRAQEKERERRLESMTPDASAPPTGQPDEGFAAQQARSLRSASRSRGPSSSRRTPSEAYAGSISASEARDGSQSPRDELRPSSIYSTGDDEDDTPTADRQSLLEDVVQEVLDEAAEESGEEEASGEGDEGVTLKDRQDAINIEHPFGLPIWKPALYRKSRSVTRNAESALHSIPSAAAERHLLPGNILWVILFGWWLALVCLLAAIFVSAAEVLGGGRGGYGKTLRGLAWYIGWPFGKYVEGEGAPENEAEADAQHDEESANGSPKYRRRVASDGASSGVTVRGTRPQPETEHPSPTTRNERTDRRETTVSFAPTVKGATTDSLRAFSDGSVDERAPLLPKQGFRRPRNKRAKILGRIIYWPAFLLLVAPLMLCVCVLCWGMVITIPMAKLTWALLELLTFRPLEINFRSAPKIPVPTPGSPSSGEDSGDTTAVSDSSPSGFTLKRARLTAGQVAPTSGPKSTVLLCTYRAIGLQYYKYTVGGVNIMFINLVPLVFFTIIDGLLIRPRVEHGIEHGHMPSHFVGFITSPALIFTLALASVIPLSYFIGMAVASISAQSSIGMGAVINATFGSIIEIILYAIALMQGKGRLVEGSIVGSILAGVLLMPGASMCSGALKRKEQKFNAKSAGVTSTMLIMAIIGTLTPTLFYQTYGTFELHCEGCPEPSGNTTIAADVAWQCNHCYYEHPDPAYDPFYQDQVKTLMYACAAILLFSYLIGLWFSLRTHASQIWQNPQQLMKVDEIAGIHPSQRQGVYNRVTPQAVMQHILPLHRAPTSQGGGSLRVPPVIDEEPRTASNSYDLPAGYTPFLDSVDRDIKNPQITPIRLPHTLTTEDFTRAVAVATVSALRHQGSIIGSHSGSAQRPRPMNSETHGGQGHSTEGAGAEEEGEAGGHEAPSWNRGVSTGVLLACTLLYAIIAEILVDVVDVVMQGSGLDEKFLGLTLFALVPNTTEFMNAVSFAMNGNIALSMEIGSAYALQVCLLQIPAMVAFSAFYDPGKMGEVVDTFTLIFPRWDVIAIILSIFLLTYTYIEARSNYHRGSILVLAYVVLVLGFYYAPPRSQGDPSTDSRIEPALVAQGVEAIGMGFQVALSKLWA